MKQSPGKPLSDTFYLVDVLIIAANGQRVEGGCVTRRSHPATDLGALAGICPGGKTGMAQFLQIPLRNW